MSDFVLCGDPNDPADFERRLSARFPEIATQIDDFERGSLHSEMAAFARATSEAIGLADFPLVRAHLSFVNELFSGAGSGLENAIYVSYLENVFLSGDDDRVATARAMLSERLAAALVELEEHWRTINNTKREARS
jgi:hypothetical protein